VFASLGAVYKRTNMGLSFRLLFFSFYLFSVICAMTTLASTPIESGLTCAVETRLPCSTAKSFLQVYVETSIYQRVVLDDREEFEERAIKSSRSPQYLLEVPDCRGRCRGLAAHARGPREPLNDVEALYQYARFVGSRAYFFFSQITNAHARLVG
jgi:hypothetical protein